MGEDGQGLERREQSDHALLSGAGSADAGLGREPGRSGATHLVSEKERRRPTDGDGIRSRPWGTGRHCAVLPGWIVAAQFAERNGT